MIGGLVGLSVSAAVLVASASAQESTCKDAVSARSRSAAQVSDASRERRARQNAITNWKRRVRDTYGWKYSFLTRAKDQDVRCGGGASAKHCTVSARPCGLW